MSNPWFRLYSEAVDDEKLRLLAFEDRWHFIALLCCKNNGILDEMQPTLMRRKVAVKLGLDLRELGEVARRLAEVGLIDEETLQPLAWDARQFKSDTSAERTRAYRDRMKRQRDVTVTTQEADTETDTESNNTNVLFVASDAADDTQASPDKPDNCPHQEILELYHRILPACPRIRDWTPARAQALRARWRENAEHRSLKYWEALFRYIANCPFLVGRGSGNRPFFASLEWICKAENFAKIREGRYEPV